MTFQMPDFAPAMPEIFLLTMVCVVLVADLFISQERRALTYLLAQASLVGTLLLTLNGFSEETVITFSGSFIRDEMGDILKLGIYVITFGVFLFSRDYLRDRDSFRGEYYVLGLFGVLGMMVMVSAYSFLTLYLGLELLSLSLYAMVVINRDSARASEAAMKYFILGALASGMLLYGMSMLYGATGSINIAEVSTTISRLTMQEMDPVLIFGLVFVMAGLAFKLGAVPFHMWIPDVYHGAPTCVTLYIGAAPKLAAFAMVFRILADGLEGLVADWQAMLVVLAVLSMALGNIVAIAQTNIKRMLAYSTISHIGFIILGLLSGTSDGYGSAMFYTLTYALMTLGAFGVVIMMSSRGFECEELDDYKGLNDRSPWFAFMMLLIMFSLAGVPPMVGFYAKLSVLQAVVGVDLLWLAIVAVIFSVIGAFYYLRVVKMMYFDKNEEGAKIEASSDVRMAVSVTGLALLVLGLFPSSLMELCLKSIA